MDFLTDTTFLVDLWRAQGKQGAAVQFVADRPGAKFAAPWVAKAEFLRGGAVAGHRAEVLLPFLENFATVFPTEDTLVRYAALYADLRKRNQLIGPHDLWVAVASLEASLPLLTRNAKEFGRVPGLQLVDYSTAVPPD